MCVHIRERQNQSKTESEKQEELFEEIGKNFLKEVGLKIVIVEKE